MASAQIDRASCRVALVQVQGRCSTRTSCWSTASDAVMAQIALQAQQPCQVVHALHPVNSYLALLGAPVQCASYVQCVWKCNSSLSSIQPLDVHIDHKFLQ